MCSHGSVSGRGSLSVAKTFQEVQVYAGRKTSQNMFPFLPKRRSEKLEYSFLTHVAANSRPVNLSKQPNISF